MYLDLVDPPVQHYAVTNTSFTPSSALQGGEIYYWYVVGDSGSITGPASATWSFWVTGAASNVSVSPALGGPPAGGLGTPTPFTFTFSSPNGWQDIVWTEMEFNYYNIGGGACFVGFWPGNQQVALMSDNAANGWLWIGSLGQSAATAPNSQCSVNLAQSSMTVVSPVAIQVTLSITFRAGLPGPQEIWMQAGNDYGTTAYWQQMGNWTTEASSPNGWAYLIGVKIYFTHQTPADSDKIRTCG